MRIPNPPRRGGMPLDAITMRAGGMIWHRSIIGGPRDSVLATPTVGWRSGTYDNNFLQFFYKTLFTKSFFMMRSFVLLLYLLQHNTQQDNIKKNATMIDIVIKAMFHQLVKFSHI